MKITGLAIVPPQGAEGNPKVTPELLASSLARYSRSNKGIETILAGVDWGNPDKSVDAIFKFVDYGHASISGMTGGIAMTIDDCSMWLAYKLFEFAQLSDGQESSTRYIKLEPSSLPAPHEVGIPSSCAREWQEFMGDAFRLYQEVYTTLDTAARKDPTLVRVPVGAGEKVVDRLRKNYALDRARYLIPFATKTNAALVMTARVWGQVIKQLDSLPLPEARHCATLLRAELHKFAPRLTKHTQRDDPTVAQWSQEIDFARRWIRAHGAGTTSLDDKVFVRIDDTLPEFLPHLQNTSQAFAEKENRYSLVGEGIRRMMVRFAWNNISIAELRDLNRHRSGYRFTPLTPHGFYLPAEVRHPELPALVERHRQLIEKLATQDETPGAHVYGYLLGVQVPFEHSTHLDKFIYEVELRTGMGAHFRYAEHLAAACREFLRLMPDAEPFVEIGTAEPE